MEREDQKVNLEQDWKGLFIILKLVEECLNYFGLRQCLDCNVSALALQYICSGLE